MGMTIMFGNPFVTLDDKYVKKSKIGHVEHLCFHLLTDIRYGLNNRYPLMLCDYIKNWYEFYWPMAPVKLTPNVTNIPATLRLNWNMEELLLGKVLIRSFSEKFAYGPGAVINSKRSDVSFHPLHANMPKNSKRKCPKLLEIPRSHIMKFLWHKQFL